ncbi:MAG: V-type ATPase 116kDa subunit family protein [Actinomycetota bacterium]|nr:V-type ATPase 116kDa subunit family protein [Actinomycetota bacterium]
MGWRDATAPVRMQRVALVCPRAVLRDMLVQVADAGVVELDHTTASGSSVDGPPSRAGSTNPRLCPTSPDLGDLERAGRDDLLAGEAELTSFAGDAVVRDEVAALAGWVPATELPALTGRLADTGAGVVPIPSPPGVDPPTLLHPGNGVRQSFTPLVETYGTVPYADVDPSVLAGVAYMLMFGMMFGDAGHGALLAVLGLLMRAGRPRALARFHKVWPFVVGSGLAAIVFGLLYGEFFGPTGVVPVLWLAPLDEPVTLLAVALGAGAVFLAGAQSIGTVNRWREGGWPLALSAPSGIAGAALLGGLGLIALGVNGHLSWLTLTGALVMAGGVALAYIGFLAASGGGGAGITQASVEVFDAVMRVGANLVSFTRLAAFGLTHAALGMIVWDGTAGLWRSGGILVAAAVIVFVVGNVLAFSLEALVAGVQALRLEYYELFSRIFAGEGRPFRPWHIPIDRSSEPVSANSTAAFGTTTGRKP